jgi:hypothetical protein
MIQGAILHRLTVDDYYRMAEVGILDPRRRYGLIDGQIVAG